MNQKYKKYTYFPFYKDWYEYIKGLNDLMDQAALYRAIANYGICKTEPRNGELSDDCMNYFQKVIRPNIAQQHDIYRKERQLCRLNPRRTKMEQNGTNGTGKQTDI